MLTSNFFNRDPQIVAKALLGKVIYHRQNNVWLSAMIIETEAYYLTDKASHASLGFTEKRRALFMSPGTIYMYYARGADSLNISCRGDGNAVLIKSGFPYVESETSSQMLTTMQRNNPMGIMKKIRPMEKLCAGQTLLCRSLGLKVIDWDQKTCDADLFYFTDVGYKPRKIIQTTRLGIPKGRDEHLPYRFVDAQHANYCTSNPLKKAIHGKCITT